MTARDHMRRLLTAAAGAILLSALGAGTALAAPEDNQVLDPNQQQGTGRVVLDAGHIDFGPTLNTGAWKIQIHDDTGSPSYWRNPEDVVLHVNDHALLAAPDSPDYSFMNVQPGTEVWVIPQTQNPDVIWAGWNTQEPGVLENLSMGATLRLLQVQGPGEMVAFLQDGNFGAPQLLFSTYEPMPQQSWIETNIHTHVNWVFTEPGVYLLELEFEGVLTDGEQVSATDVLRVAVGDQTNPEDAFAEELEAEAPAADSDEGATSTADTGQEDASQSHDTAILEADDQENSMLPILIGVVAVVALALVGAMITLAVASRKAKARARAAAAAKARDRDSGRAQQPVTGEQDDEGTE